MATITRCASPTSVEEAVCSVCLVGFHNGVFFSTPSLELHCGHRIHRECLGNCVVSRLRNCPECRAPFTKLEVVCCRHKASLEHLATLPQARVQAHSTTSIFGAVHFEDSRFNTA